MDVVRKLLVTGSGNIFMFVLKTGEIAMTVVMIQAVIPEKMDDFFNTKIINKILSSGSKARMIFIISYTPNLYDLNSS